MCVIFTGPAELVTKGFWAYKEFGFQDERLTSRYLPTNRLAQESTNDYGSFLYYQEGELAFSPLDCTEGLYCLIENQHTKEIFPIHHIYIPVGATIRRGKTTLYFGEVFVTDMLYVGERVEK